MSNTPTPIDEKILSQHLNQSHSILNKSALNKSIPITSTTNFLNNVKLDSKLEKQKAEMNISDHVQLFNSINVHQHDIDRIKTDDRINAANYASKQVSTKLSEGMLIIELILKERLIFISAAQLNEQSMMKIIQKISDLCQIEAYEDLQVEEMFKLFANFKQILLDGYQAFERINNMLLGMDQCFLHLEGWQDQIRLSKNEYVIGLLELTLIDSSNAFYRTMKKLLLALQQITGSTMNDEQIQKLLNYLPEVTEMLTKDAPIHLKLVSHSWMDEVIKIQNGFQQNTNVFYEQIGALEGSISGLIHKISNIDNRMTQMHQRNQKCVRILKRVILPQKYDNLNMSYSVQCQELLNMNSQKINSTKDEIQKLRGIEVPFIQGLSQEELFKPVGTFKGPLKLTITKCTFLEEAVKNKQNLSTTSLNDVSMEHVAITQLYNRFKELLVSEKKLSKAFSVLSDVQVLVKGHQKQPMTQNNAQACYQGIIKLQKYTNHLANTINIAINLSQSLPKIQDFITIIQRFISKSTLLIEDAAMILGLRS